ncbi:MULTISPECIES: methyltransferase domain-containing protein [unclassified Corallococcus]|uniref:methyltransferase domain-containing protein n=1 Tax=unclassified Corallococcus TaxID=2685029 RepID=UPI001A8CCD79|nr:MULTISPECIES: methyltransferase domain-containing protein [unclassified Corallococcus]MBN9681274.1 methyltransferase domain-containing protein [Corallococcus sp. NCSPR001]WAS87146.1 methyltransferase domain-containing protein [Corallococcus sp. NCRR]
MMWLRDVALLACPDCRGQVVWHGQSEDDRLDEGRLLCGGCGEAWTVEDGLARLYREDRVQGTDRLMRHLYDGLPALHDPLTTVLTPLFQSVSESRMRDGYMRRLELGALKPRGDGQPVRVLEVGVGAGANLPRIRGALPPGLPVEVWGLDLSTGMLAQCEKRLRKGRGVKDTRLLVADAHALPFKDGLFDRVFHVGGIGSYRQPAVALREMARVARPGTPLVVVDEQLDAAFRPSLFQRAAFRALTFYTREAKSPRDLLPRNAEDVIEEQVSPFYYCLTFRVPAVTG